MPDESPTQLIDKLIAHLGDRRGKTLASMRGLIKQAIPDLIEEWKWHCVPVWYLAGMIRTGETYTAVVKLTFFTGPALDAAYGLFNSGLEGNVRRAIDIRKGQVLDEGAFIARVIAAVTLTGRRAKLHPGK